MIKKISGILLAVIAAAAFVFEIPTTAFCDIAEAASYESTLRAAGFTDSYISALTELHSKYPNWNFEALVTGIDWADAVASERTPHSQQLIQKTDSNTKKNYYCTCSACYKNGSYVIQEGSSWVSASKSAVEYYMNPTNFLDEKNIFQFLSTAYNSSETASAVETILSGTFMSNAYITYKNSGGSSVTYSPKTKYSSAIISAAKNSGLSAYYLAAKIVQEVGGKTNSAGGVSGTNSTYPGIYNYYNIGATSSATDGLKWASTSTAGYSTNCTANLRKSASSSSTKLVTLPTGTKLTYKSTTAKQSDGYKWYYVTVTYSGTTYTGYIRSDLVTVSSTDKYNRPWTNPYLSIYNGAVYIASGFSETQYTGYLQKFNVNPASGSKMYSHEYMANVQGAAAEAQTTYSAYKSAGLLSKTKTFVIPVYKNMPGDVVESTKITLSATSVKIDAGKTKTLTATLTPSNSTDSVTYSSSNTSVATVNANGKITAVAPGTATVTAKTSSGLTAKCTVTVNEVASTAVSLGYTHKGTVKSKCTLRKSKSESAAAVVSLPKSATVTIKSSSSGWYNVSYTKSGKTYTGYVKTSNVTRNADITLVAGKTKTLKYTLTPSNSTDSVTYKSADTTVAKVSSAGKITAVSAGTVVIRITTESGKTDFVKVKVKKAVAATAVSLGYTHKGTVKSKCTLRKSKSESSAAVVSLPKSATVTIKSSSSGWYKVSYTKSGKTYTGYVKTSNVTRNADITLVAGKTKTLKYTLSPSNSTDTVTYKSANTAVAKVTSAGKITAVSAGTAVIRITTESGKTDFVKVKVKKAVKSTAVSLGYTHKGTVTASVLNVRKSASTNASVLTTLSNGATVTILSTSGGWYKVTFKKSGKSYTGYVSTSYVTRAADITLKAGKTKTLSAKLTPSNSTDTVTYKSANTSVAKVSSGGKITAVSAGTTEIKVTTESGKTDFVTVKVTK